MFQCKQQKLVCWAFENTVNKINLSSWTDFNFHFNIPNPQCSQLESHREQLQLSCFHFSYRTSPCQLWLQFQCILLHRERRACIAQLHSHLAYQQIQSNAADCVADYATPNFRNLHNLCSVLFAPQKLHEDVSINHHHKTGEWRMFHFRRVSPRSPRYKYEKRHSHLDNLWQFHDSSNAQSPVGKSSNKSRVKVGKHLKLTRWESWGYPLGNMCFCWIFGAKSCLTKRTVNEKSQNFKHSSCSYVFNSKSSLNLWLKALMRSEVRWKCFPV